MAIIQILGSLYFAVSLIAGLALTLIASTLLESFYGTPFVQKHFYQTTWFNIFLGLLAVNILLSAVSRFPYKKRHTGFVMTHVGILLLLGGSLLSSLLGIDGQMMLFEGEKKSGILLNTYELIIHGASGKASSFTLASGNRKIKRRLDSSAGPLELTIHRVWDNAVIKSDIVHSPAAPINHAAELSLSSRKTGVNETLWLIENNPLNPGSGRLSMGPAVFQISEKPKEAPKTQGADEPSRTAKLRLFKKEPGFDYSIDLENIPPGDIPLGQSSLKVSALKYYPDARVGENNKLVSASDEPNNPAVEFNIVGAEGGPQHYMKFALYPEFESMHGKGSKKISDLTIELSAPSSTSTKDSGPSLSIYYSPDGSWSYVSKSSSSVSEGTLKTGETYQTGWMDFSFHIKNLMDRAGVVKKVERAPGSGKGQIAAEVSIAQHGKILFEGWVLADGVQSFHIGEQHMDLTLQARNHKVPFSLELKDFRKVDYPGTRQPSSYESDVTLVDPEENLTISKTISMNKPLDHKGYRIFQSSFIQDASGEASVFTVAKNPGITLIYIGCTVMFLGSFLVFFVAPFSSMLKEGKK